MKFKLDGPAILVCLATMLSIAYGGQLSNDSLGLMPGFSALISAMGGSGEVALLPHAILGGMASAALIWILLSRRIVQCPPQKLILAVAFLVALIDSSVIVSSFKAVSVPVALEWSIYAVAMVAATAALGRKFGPQALLGSCFAGSIIVAFRGILEYGAQKGVDPNWRIFAGWVNPNATAAALIIGFFAGLALFASAQRIPALLSLLGLLFVGLALALTGSKGGILAIGVGLIAFFLLSALWADPKKLLKPAGAVVATVAVVFLFQFAQTKQAKSLDPGATAAMSRLSTSGESSDQSAEFRKLLWKGSVDLIRENPVGSGIGTYRYYSSKPGLTTQTRLSHNAFLQLGAEVGVIAPILFLAIAGYWLWRVARGARRQPRTEGNLLAAIVATLVAIGAHCFVDSDLYYFGIGLPFFVLMGTGLLVASDAVAPEFLPGSLRRVGALVAITFPVFLAYFGVVEIITARARGDIAMQDMASARQGFEMAAGLSPGDAEITYMLSRFSSSEAERLAKLKLAVDQGPSTRNLRSLARAQAQSDSREVAVTTLNRALQLDPNNLPALLQLLELHDQAKNAAAANNAAERLVAVEGTPYFEIRSLPEIVPTETYQGRLYLARHATNASDKLKQLRPAVEGFLNYAKRTIPAVRRGIGGDAGASSFAGETLEKVKQMMELGLGAARELAALQRTLRDEAEATKADEAVAIFEAELAK